MKSIRSAINLVIAAQLFLNALYFIIICIKVLEGGLTFLETFSLTYFHRDYFYKSDIMLVSNYLLYLKRRRVYVLSLVKVYKKVLDKKNLLFLIKMIL